MKKLFFYLLACMMFITSCHDEPKDSFKLQIDQIEGEWVYDHPEEGIWEMQKFLPSGIFYYSSKVTGNWKFQNSMNDGRYWLDNNNQVTCQYFINGVASQIKMTVLEISPYSYTAEYNDGATLGRFTYAKLLSRIELKPQEKIKLDYGSLVNTHITGFKSHNSNIAEVDDTGVVTSLNTGHTYIDLITDEGTAVIEIIVFDRDNMFGDYSFAFGKTIPEIVEIVGDDYSYREDTNGVAYYLDDYLSDELYFITGNYDNTHVEFVQLRLNENISKTVIISHLDTKYSKLSDKDGIYNYITDQSVEGNPVAIIYDSNEFTLSYVVVKPMDRWNDFSYLFGESDNAVNKEMTEWGYKYLFSDYSYSKDGSDYYDINDSEDATLVGFVFNSENKMCEYWVYLYEDFMSNSNDILNWLKSKYTLSANESTKSQYIFYDKNNRLRVVFDSSGYVSYTDSQQTPFTPATRSLADTMTIPSGKYQAKSEASKSRFYLKAPVFIKN